jgi:hypothetical protein
VLDELPGEVLLVDLRSRFITCSWDVDEDVAGDVGA